MAKKKKAASVNDMMAALGGSAPTKPAAKKKGDRGAIDLGDALQQEFHKFATLKCLSDKILGAMAAVKSKIQEGAFKKWIQSAWASKTQPKNPKMVCSNNGAVDAEGMFIVTSRFKVEIPKGFENNPDEGLTNLLVQLGLTDKQAKRLMGEVDCQPNTAIRPLNELNYGHYGEDKEFIDATPIEKSAGEKFLHFALGQKVDPLTPEERAVAIIQTPNVFVKGGFLQRVTMYVDEKNKNLQPEQQLAAIFTVIEPVLQTRGAKIGITDGLDSEATRARMVAAAADVLGLKL